MFVWSGNSCPLPLTLVLILIFYAPGAKPFSRRRAMAAMVLP